MQAPRASGGEDGGFTLLEVLVAFTIASFLLVAVLRALTIGLDGGRRSEAYADAVILAQSALDTLGVAAPLHDGDDVVIQNGPFRIVASVRRYNDPNVANTPGQYLVLYQVSSTVTWRDGRMPRSVSLQTLRLGPAG